MFELNASGFSQSEVDELAHIVRQYISEKPTLSKEQMFNDLQDIGAMYAEAVRLRYSFLKPN